MLEKENNLPAISEFTDFLDEILSEISSPYKKLKNSLSPHKIADSFDFKDKVYVLEAELLKSKQIEVNLNKKILRLEAIAFKNPTKTSSFRLKAPNFLDTNLTEIPSNVFAYTPMCTNFKETPELTENNRYLTPNNKQIIKAFQLKKSDFMKQITFPNSATIKKSKNLTNENQSLKFEAVLSKPNKLNSNSPRYISYPQNAENTNSDYNATTVESPTTKLENFKKEVIEQVKTGALEVIMEKEQKIHELSSQLSEHNLEIQSFFEENMKLKESFSKIFEEMQYENEGLVRKLDEEKIHYKRKLEEMEVKVQENCNEFLNQQMEKYKKQEIILNSELDDKRYIISRLERENLLLSLKFIEKEKDMYELQREIERRNMESERDQIKNSEKNNNFLEIINEKELSLKEKYEEIKDKLKICEDRLEEVKRENVCILREKNEIYLELEDLLEEKQEIEKLNWDIKEFSQRTIDKYEKMIQDIQIFHKKELKIQRIELNKLKDISLKSYEENKENMSLYEDFRKSNDEEMIKIIQNENKIEIDYIENLKEEIKLLEHVAVEAKLLAAQASTDRDYFHFKYKQSLEFIKGMNRGGEITDKPKEGFNFFKEIMRKFLKF